MLYQTWSVVEYKIDLNRKSKCDEPLVKTMAEFKFRVTKNVSSYKFKFVSLDV